jgi:cyclophilin family peptidyl-prolyl cis-trans isomerase
MNRSLALACFVALAFACEDNREPRDAGSEHDAGRARDGGSTPDGGAEVLYAPSGFVVSPFLSETPTREFAQMPAPGSAIEAGRDYQLVFETDVGRIVMDVFEDQTPITAESMVWLARHRFYDGIAFHRVIEGFMAQTGDPNTLGEDRESWGSGGAGYEFGLEIVAALRFDRAGVVGMARTADPNTNGSQFFITIAAASHLDGMYTVFGEVTEGLDVLDEIERSPAPAYPPPTTPSRIVRAYAVDRAAP